MAVRQGVRRWVLSLDAKQIQPLHDLTGPPGADRTRALLYDVRRRPKSTMLRKALRKKVLGCALEETGPWEEPSYQN